ncbi:MAG: hypothetical protein IPG60_08520 [Bacteroidetes bacterium]|nr:hypothetical protein [Bacteroidota bacterium]
MQIIIFAATYFNYQMKRLSILGLIVLSIFLSNCSTQMHIANSGGLQAGDAELYALAENAKSVEFSNKQEIQFTNKEVEIKNNVSNPIEIYATEQIYFQKEDTIIPEDSVEVEPVIHPFAFIGVGLTGAAAVTAVLVVTGPMISILWPLLLLGGGLLFATLAIKKIKRDPKKYKGEKLATAVYWAMLPLGLLLMLLPIYWMFNF